ncbi:MAG: ribonuclease III [Candidatus Gracilibacteria bacterium]|jgi:ribonuclease-3|nr:ribonuclease III [Candidatus Gracilibacteria bacterium]
MIFSKKTNNGSRFEALEKKLGISMNKKEFFDEAFTHKSFINENRTKNLKYNERLEFLGDAVLELLCTRFLFDKFPNEEEGVLTAYRSALVKGQNLARVARELDLGALLLMSKGEEKSGGRSKSYLLANVFEALVGAIYLDSSLEEVDRILRKFLFPEIKNIIKHKLHKDPKSLFQEYAQERVNTTPHFELISEKGPDHNKVFVVGAYLGERCVAEGRGSSKQKASSDAAKNAIINLNWN